MSVELRNVSFAYPDGSVAVEEVSLEIGEGERLAIIGQNGAGKTTTVKMMNGLLKPTSGEVFVDGVSTAHRSTASVARDVGYVFQNPDDQISASTVLAELEYMPRYLKWDEDLTSKRVQRALKLTGIGRFLDTNPNACPSPSRNSLRSQRLSSASAVTSFSTSRRRGWTPTASPSSMS